MADWEKISSPDLSPHIMNDEEIRFQLGWTSNKVLVVSIFSNEVKTHIRRFRHKEAREWIPTNTGILLTPSEIKELAQFLPKFSQVYFLLEERLRKKMIVAEVEKTEVVDDMEMVTSSSDRMEIDVPSPLDIEYGSSLVEEFGQILQLIHSDKVVDEIQKIERSLCYRCQNDCPGIKDLDLCLTDLESRVDKCFNTVYENVALEPLFQKKSRENTLM